MATKITACYQASDGLGLPVSLSAVGACPVGFDGGALRALAQALKGLPVAVALWWALQRIKLPSAFSLGLTELSFGQIALIAAPLQHCLMARELAPVLKEFGPALTFKAAGVSVQPYSSLPSVTTVLLPDPDSDEPALVTERRYSPYRYGPPLMALDELQYPNFTQQLMPQRNAHLKHGSMYWARLASDQVREHLRDPLVKDFPAPRGGSDLSLCAPGRVPGNDLAWAVEEGTPLHLALQTTAERAWTLPYALEDEVCSYLDLLPETPHAAVPPTVSVAAPVATPAAASAPRGRTVDLEPLFADALVAGSAPLGLGQATVAPDDATLQVPRSNPHYIFARETLYEVLLYLTEPTHDALFLVGPTGCGKTSALFEVAARLRWPIESVTLSQKSEVSDLIGSHTLQQGSLRYCYGPLTRAMRSGEILLLNEIDLMPPGELAALNDVLEGRALTISANHGEVITPHPFFRVVATANSKGTGDDSGAYHGVRLQNQAFLDRWRFCEVDYPSAAQERLMLTRACPELNPDFVDGILHFATEVRLGQVSEPSNRVLLRRLAQAEARLVASSVQDLKDCAAALRSLVEGQVDVPQQAALQAELQRAELTAQAFAAQEQLAPFFDELLAHKSLLAQHDATVDETTAHQAANDLFAHYEDAMPGFEDLHERSCAQLQQAQAVAQVEAQAAERSGVSGLSAPFSSRSLLRIAQLYYAHDELSVQEAISLGFASRLPAAEYEYLLRLSYDIFGYGSNFNSLPHKVSDPEAYAQVKAQLLKYSLSQVQANLTRLQRCQARVLKAQTPAPAPAATSEPTPVQATA